MNSLPVSEQSAIITRKLGLGQKIKQADFPPLGCDGKAFQTIPRTYSLDEKISLAIRREEFELARWMISLLKEDSAIIMLKEELDLAIFEKERYDLECSSDDD